MCDFGIISGPVMAALVGTAAEATATGVATAGLFGAGGTFAAGLTAAGGAAVSAGSIASTAGSIASLGSTLLSGVGSIIGGNRQQAAAEANAKTQNMLAKDAERRGSVAEGEQRTKYEQFIGKQRAIMGSSGIVADEGSFGDILAQSAEFGERDAQQLRANAEREAFGHKAQAQNDTYQGQQAMTAGIVKGGSSLLSGSFDLFKQSPWWKSWTGSTATVTG
jgi:hypothetical protein